MHKPKIVFILTSISQPRCIKRIKSFIYAGFEVKIYGFDRGQYIENANIEGYDIIVLGNQKNGSDYFSKLKQSYVSLNRIINIEGNKNTVFYCFGYMTAAFAMLKRLNYIYEISDILYEKKKFKYIKGVIRKIDKIIVKRSRLTVMTSKGFLQHLFDDKEPNNIIIQPNRVDSSFNETARPHIKKFDINQLKFSFIGAIRFNTIFNFARTVGKYHSKHQFHFYGESNSSSEAIELAKRYQNIFYHGSYKNPDDLINIYNNIDVVISCYDVKSTGIKIAEPNKLYESMYFFKPIVVSENSFLSDQVEKFGAGFSINPYSEKEISDFINSLDEEVIQDKIDNIKTIPIEEIVDNNGINIIEHLNNNPFYNDFCW